MPRRFLCSTAWAKQHGFDAEQIKLFSLSRQNLWRVLVFGGIGALLIFGQTKMFNRLSGNSELTVSLKEDAKRSKELSVRQAKMKTAKSADVSGFSANPLVMSPVSFDSYNLGLDQLNWGFKCFVPPDHLATFLFVYWSNGVPTIDEGISAYIKVGAAGGIDIPFCSLSCHRIQALLDKTWTEDQRKKIFNDWNISDSANPTNIVQWNVNLGGGFTGSKWKEMPTYHQVQPKFPISLRSGYQRAIRFVDFDNSEANTKRPSGVELRAFLQSLTLPSIRARANEIDRTNYVYGSGLVGTMDDALIAIKTVPLEP